MEDFPGLEFICKEFEDLKVVVDGGWFARNTIKNKNYIDVHPHPVTNAIGKNVSSSSMWNIVNQLGKHDVL